ncbi:MAG: hypothetical protein HYS56_06140 [Candidatus Omnitrophica bacterium]|nr:hypothetical protein [Candidatus Omnitrophota bacterium]
MTKNITLRIDDGILRRAKHVAIEQDRSLSQWVAHLITKSVTGKSGFYSARKRALKRMENGLHLTGKPLTREQIYGR